MKELLGATVIDRITGFTGVVTGVVYYISGCNQALVVPKMTADGKLPDSQWFDVQRLQTRLAEGIVVLDNSQSPGCDRAPPRR